MGKGVALSFKRKFPCLPKIMGKRLKKSGKIFYILKPLENILALQTKTHYSSKSDLNLVKKTIRILELYTKENLEKTFSITLLGTENGGLSEKVIIEELENKLLDNVTLYKIK